MRRRTITPAAAALAALLAHAPALAGDPSFVHWESPHVSPIAMTPDGQRLLAVNTPDNRLEVFSLGGAAPVYLFSVPVGLDPVSVRARTDDEIWVVNHVSDSISIVSLAARNVVTTIVTGDEPADVVFAGAPQRAFVTISQRNRVEVYDPANPDAPPATVAIEGEDPRMLATDGQRVFAAIFESGNDTTILGGGSTMNNGFPPNVVNNPAGPYGGVNPPPNDGAAFRPPLNPSNPAPPRVGMIVRQDDAGVWRDDNNADWTALVSGAQAGLSGRPVGWDLFDHDVAIIDADSLSVSYQRGLMNACMALGFNAATGEVAVVGTDATNEIRFEPVLNGRFLRVNYAVFTPGQAAPPDVVDLNPHLAYTDDIPFVPIAQAQRDRSVGDPRAIVWNDTGGLGYIAAMGSNNVIVVDPSGARVGLSDTIEVGEGPTGVVFDGPRNRLYVLNKFEGSISVVDALTETQTAVVPFYDPSPDAIKLGRRHLYSTHDTSGLGHIACGSCHIDGRTDRLSWDLGDPSGEMRPFNQNCLLGGCDDWHPMKGPMATQTLQDIIGLEPLHWRGDRNGLEEFNGAFIGLLGDDVMLTDEQMQQFEDFLATIYYPPNPNRNFDNSLPTSMPLPGHFTTGRFGAPGLPLPNGNAVAGLNAYRTADLDAVECVSCHTLPTGVGPNGFLQGLNFVEIPPGPDGELHHALVSVDGSTNVSIKIPQLRNMHEKTGFNTTQQFNTAGFGYLHDGSIDSIERFIAEPVFSVSGVQQVADLSAFMLAFAGGDLPLGSPNNPLELPGPTGKDTHAAVGAQTTLVSEAAPLPGQLDRIDAMRALADAGAVGLVVKGAQSGIQRGYVYTGAGEFQSDRAAETLTFDALRAAAAPGEELTYTVVVKGTETRIGIDRDEDGHLDRDEIDAGSNPADPASVPGNVCAADVSGDGAVDGADLAILLGQWGAAGSIADLDGDGDVNGADLAILLGAWGACP